LVAAEGRVGCQALSKPTGRISEIGGRDNLITMALVDYLSAGEYRAVEIQEVEAATASSLP